MYPELIKTICSALTGSDKGQPDLTLAPIHDETQVDERGRPVGGTFEIPATILPEFFQAQFLPGNETFLEGAESLLVEKAPQTVFAIPPWLHERHLSEEFRREHHFGLIEAFAEQVFNPPQPADVQLELGESSTSASIRTSIPEVLIMFIPDSILCLKKHGRWRTQYFPNRSAVLIEHQHCPDLLGFEFPFNLLFRATTLVLQKEPGPLRFFKITEEMVSGNIEPVLGDLATLLERQGGPTRFGYVYRDELTPDYPTTYDFYSPATEALRASVQDLSTKVSLAQVADVLMGFHPTPGNMGDPQEERFQFITGRNITADGSFDFSDLRQMEPDQSARGIRLLEIGDICVRRIRQPNGQAQFIAAVFPGSDSPLAFNHSVIVIRPKPAISDEQRLVILAFLRSSVARDLFFAKGNSMQLHTHVLRDFPVPLADKDLTTAIRGLSEAREAFSEWTAKLDQDLANLISNRDMAQSRMNLLSAGQLARQRYRAARQVEDLDYRIRTQYPLPLAYLWRDWQVSSPHPSAELDNLLKAGEGFACFFSMIAILVARHCKLEIGYLGTISERLKQGSGTNFGDWFSILKEVGESRKFRDLDGEVPFFEVTQIMRSKEVFNSLDLLKKKRDDDSHRRINRNSIPPSLLKNLESALRTIYDAVAFTGDYGLIQVKYAKFDSITRKTDYSYADLTGDNPLVPKRTAITTQVELENDSLYLRDRQGYLHLFRPFLHYLECPECHLMSTFYLDTYSGSGSTVGLKSFERNSVREEEFADQFRWGGLLKSENKES